MQFEDDFDDAELLAMMDAPMVRTKIAVPTNEVPSSNEQPKPAAPTAVTPGPPLSSTQNLLLNSRTRYKITSAIRVSVPGSWT